jgi:hypothetical protein
MFLQHIKSGLWLSLVVFALTMAVSSCTSDNEISSWRLVFQNDLHGNTISGSRKALSSALKRGSPLRVAWGEKLEDGRSVVEFAVPDFISLMADSEVVVQFPGHIIQTSYIDPHTSELRTAPTPTVWRALMSTDGRFHQFHYELKTGEVARTMHARTAMSWYVLAPSQDNRPMPEIAQLHTFQLDSVWRKQN